MVKFFPQGIATDNAFCNRISERQALKESINSHEHLVLIAPRRYGKSSLIAQVLKENDFFGISIDLFFALTQTEVIRSITDGVSQVISDILPKTQSAVRKIADSITTLSPKLTINLLGQKVEIGIKQTTEKTISEVLLALDHVAQKANKSCVIVLDEFQQVGELKENHAIEAAIRHAVERSKQVSYIFCGSKRHLLNEMFSDTSRPLYHLCDLMIIERIHDEAYKLFLNEMSQAKWQQGLEGDIATEIIHLTENHPYYLNALCRKLWRGKKPPTLSDVRNTWDNYVIQQSVWIADDIANLTLNRKKVLTALAYQATNEPQGQAFSVRAALTPSTIKKALTDLIKLDLVLQNEEGYYQVLDPAVSYYIRKNTH